MKQNNMRLSSMDAFVLATDKRSQYTRATKTMKRCNSYHIMMAEYQCGGHYIHLFLLCRIYVLWKVTFCYSGGHRSMAGC